jgi:3-phosphoshikimate 1-carboxyvinyltransferase
MGADIVEENPGEHGGEPVADLRRAPRAAARHRGAGALVPDMIDEFPALFVAAACAEGRPWCAARPNCGSRNPTAWRHGQRAARPGPPGRGNAGWRDDPSRPLQGGVVDSHGDHRIAMAFPRWVRSVRGRGADRRRGQRGDLVPGFDALARGVGCSLSDA